MTFTFMGFHIPQDGYGYATIKIAAALARLGVGALDMRDADAGWGQVGEQTWESPTETAVALCTPDWLPFIWARRVVAYTMFEASKLPQGWVEKINGHAVACVVPCEWCRQVFVENGVRVPIEVVRWGVDPEDYWLLKRPARTGPYRFLWSGTPDRRKGFDLAYRAFWEAFGKRDDVELVMHFRKMPKGVRGCNDPNVRIVEGMFDRPALRVMLEEADCYVFPSRGEGWGSPPREAAATGLPVIATNWGGLAEEIERWGLPLRVMGKSRADYGHWEDTGEWAEPDFGHLVELMRWCFENREDAARFGERAALWSKFCASWERTARGICEVVDGLV